MKPQYFNSKKTTILEPYGCIRLEDLIKDFQELVEQGVTHLEIELGDEDEYGAVGIDISLFEYRTETEEEKQERESKIADYLQRQKEQEYQTYLQLKSKFENDDHISTTKK